MAAHTECKQVGEISAIKVKLENQAQADDRIEENLKALTEEVRNNQKASQEEFNNIGKALTSLQDSIDTQSKDLKGYHKEVRDYSDALNKLHTRVVSVEKDITTNKVDIGKLQTEHANTVERVMKIEKWIAWIVACVSVFFVVVQFFEHLDTVKKILIPELQQQKTQQSIVIENEND